MNPCESCGINDRMTGWKHCADCDSTIGLAGGKWVPDRMGIQRWVPNKPRRRLAVADESDDLGDLNNECPVCNADRGTRCVSGGRFRNKAHRARWARCSCGQPLHHNRRKCSTCQPDARYPSRNTAA